MALSLNQQIKLVNSFSACANKTTNWCLVARPCMVSTPASHVACRRTVTTTCAINAMTSCCAANASFAITRTSYRLLRVSRRLTRTRQLTSSVHDATQASCSPTISSGTVLSASLTAAHTASGPLIWKSISLASRSEFRLSDWT